MAFSTRLLTAENCIASKNSVRATYFSYLVKKKYFFFEKKYDTMKVLVLKQHMTPENNEMCPNDDIDFFASGDIVTVKHGDTIDSLIQKQFPHHFVSSDIPLQVGDEVNISRNKIIIRRNPRKPEQEFFEHYALRDLNQEEKEERDYARLLQQYERDHTTDVEEAEHHINLMIRENTELPFYIGTNFQEPTSIADILMAYNSQHPASPKIFDSTVDPDLYTYQLQTGDEVYFPEDENAMILVLTINNKRRYRVVDLCDG